MAEGRLALGNNSFRKEVTAATSHWLLGLADCQARGGYEAMKTQSAHAWAACNYVL